MKTEKIKITFINPLNRTVETRNYQLGSYSPDSFLAKQQDIDEKLQAEFGEEILYGITTVAEY